MDYKITTATISGKFENCELNIFNIGEFLRIDNDILGIKYRIFDHDVLRGCYETSKYTRSKKKNDKTINKKSFNNQVSILLKYDNDNYNIKLFQNGSFQFTGVKSISKIEEIAKFLHYKLEICDQENSYKIPKNENGFYGLGLGVGNVFYNTTGNIIGYVKDSEYIINSKKYKLVKTPKNLKYDGENVLLQNVTSITKQVEIVNQNGNLIAIQTYRKNTSKRICNKNVVADYYNGIVTYNDNVMGFFDYEYNGGEASFPEPPVVIRNQQKTSGYTNVIYDINCINTLIDTKNEINRDLLYENLKNNGYFTHYDPNTYAGVKLIYKFTKQDVSGRCHCENKCICETVTFMIFGSGKIIASGFKSLANVDIVTNEFKKILEKAKI